MIEFIQPGWDAPPGVRAGCTTRAAGISGSSFDNFNMAMHVGDDQVRVEQNRSLLRTALELPAEPCWISQTHGTHSVVLELDASRDADAAITRLPGTVAVVMTADCLPILVCNRNGSEVAAIHAGWRGLQAGVIQSALAKMESPRDQMMVWIGPGISQACFEVGEEVRTAFLQAGVDIEAHFHASRQGHWLCNLAGLAEGILKVEGVTAVYRDAHCSFRDVDKFYSYRREPRTGRMASLIWFD